MLPNPYFLIGLFICLAIGVQAQQVSLRNGSFEGKRGTDSMPDGWMKCDRSSSPDVLPGPWNVRDSAASGATYIGLVTRNNGHHESIGQRLSEPLRSGHCYYFSMMLSHSLTYSSYNMHTRLRIWGSSSECEKQYLLVESDAVTHEGWKLYEFSFTPKQDLHFVLFEASNAPGIYFDYNGNILIDECSDFEECRRVHLDGM